MVRPSEAAAAWSSSLGQMVGFRCVCVRVWVCGSGICVKEGKQTSVCFSEEQSTQVANGYAA